MLQHRRFEETIHETAKHIVYNNTNTKIALKSPR